MFVLLTNVMRAKVYKILQTETFFGGICRKVWCSTAGGKAELNEE